MRGKLRMWRKRVKTNSYSQDIPYEMYYNVTTILKFGSAQKQSRIYNLSVYVQESNYTHTESRQCNMVSDSDDEGFFDG